MLKTIKNKIKENKEFLKDNFILFSGLFILNVLGYFFHFYAGRKLGPEDYGIFGSLLSLVYIILMPLNSLQAIISKFVSNFKVKNEYNKIAYLISRSLKKLFIIGVIVTIIFWIVSPLIASFLKIEKLSSLVIVSFIIIWGILVLLIRGLLQGLQKFKLLGLSYIIEGIGKFGCGVLLISLGFGVNGAIGSLVLSYIVAFILVFIFAIKFLRMKKEKFDTWEIYKYALPVFLMLISLTLFYSIDVLLVKHFLSPIDAGYYAALSLLGKIIFFGSLSVSMVMFPKVSESHILNKDHKNILYKSLLLILSFGGAVSLFYFLFSRFTVNLLFGKDYLEITNLLGLFGIVITIFSLIYILSFYYASINKTKFIYLLILFNLLEAILIWFFHNSLMQIIIILLIIFSILFLIMILGVKGNAKLDINYSSIQ